MKIPDCFHTLEQGTNMDNEDLLKKRFKELAERAYQSGCYTFTGFLGLSEIALFHKIAAEVSHVGYTLYGGSPDCERRMIAFGRESDMGYPVSYPVCLLKITPRAEKYADEWKSSSALLRDRCVRPATIASARFDATIRWNDSIFGAMSERSMSVSSQLTGVCFTMRSSLIRKSRMVSRQ